MSARAASARAADRNPTSGFVDQGDESRSTGPRAHPTERVDGRDPLPRGTVRRERVERARRWPRASRDARGRRPRVPARTRPGSEPSVAVRAATVATDPDTPRSWAASARRRNVTSVELTPETGLGCGAELEDGLGNRRCGQAPPQTGEEHVDRSRFAHPSERTGCDDAHLAITVGPEQMHQVGLRTPVGGHPEELGGSCPPGTAAPVQAPACDLEGAPLRQHRDERLVRLAADLAEQLGRDPLDRPTVGAAKLQGRVVTEPRNDPDELRPGARLRGARRARQRGFVPTSAWRWHRRIRPAVHRAPRVRRSAADRAARTHPAARASTACTRLTSSRGLNGLTM